MTFNDLLDRLWFADFETFAHDWLLVCINYRTGEEKIFHNCPRNDIYEWLNKEKPILCGHNFAYYDKYILKAILSGFTPEEVKKVNDYIIHGGQGFELDYGEERVELPPIWDTMQDIVPVKSLKEIEGCLGLDITETTIPFDLPTKWTKEQYEEVLYYCRADVNALRPLFEARLDYFETKYDICKLSNIDPATNMGLTNAKLCAKFLEAKKVDRDDERDYTIPSTIHTEFVDQRILDFFNRIHDTSIPSEVLFKTKLEMEEHGMPTVVSWGGKHGALPNFIFIQENEPEMVVINCDFASLYPHLLALPQYNFISRNIKDKNAYANTLKHRLELKHQGKKKEQKALKLILNTTYGCELNQYNDLYDARGARGTCITGQLLISELTERVFRVGNVQLIQVNTDGLMVKLPRTELDEYYKVCNEFSKNCGIELEYDIITKIIQRDVNNYIMLYDDKGKSKIKAKGGCFSGLPNLSIQEDGNVISEYEVDFKQNSLVICAEAIARNLLFDTPVEYTINNCNDVSKFQMITHLGGTYEKCIYECNGEVTDLQRNNRVYAGKEKTGAMIYKIKSDGKKDKLASCPTNPIIDNKNEITIDKINKSWYIKYTKQRVSDFVRKGDIFMEDKLEKLKKDELIAMIKNNNRSDDSTAPINASDKALLLQKITKFREKMRKRNFILDKELPKNLGGGEIYSIDQIYQAVQDISLECGLDFSFETTEMTQFDLAAFKPMTGASQNIATVKSIITFADIDTGCEKTYTMVSQGSDSIDKAVNSASTMAFRNWFTKNFTPSRINGEDIKYGDGIDNDVVTDEIKSQPKTPTFIPAEKKQEIVKEITSEPQKTSSDDDFDEVTDLIMELRELSGNPKAGEKTMSAMLDGSISDIDLMNAKLKLQNTIADLKNK